MLFKIKFQSLSYVLICENRERYSRKYQTRSKEKAIHLFLVTDDTYCLICGSGFVQNLEVRINITQVHLFTPTSDEWKEGTFLMPWVILNVSKAKPTNSSRSDLLSVFPMSINITTTDTPFSLTCHIHPSPNCVGFHFSSLPPLPWSKSLSSMAHLLFSMYCSKCFIYVNSFIPHTDPKRCMYTRRGKWEQGQVLWSAYHT